MSDKRNPPWQRDELILALDLFLKSWPKLPPKNGKEVIGLSEALNKLPIHDRSDTSGTFRNPAGVYMKLMNFLRFAPDYNGKGLKAGNKLEEEVWNEFSDDPQRLRNVSAAILSASTGPLNPTLTNFTENTQEIEAEEGKVLSRVHYVRERDSKIVAEKKARFFKEHQKLFCEACGFDFVQKYGQRGEGYIECHHTRPLSEAGIGQSTKLSDLVLLCANCHRMVHAKRPWLTLRELQETICLSGVQASFTTLK